MGGQPLFQAPVTGHAFNSFEEIPPLAVKSLLIIENRFFGVVTVFVPGQDAEGYGFTSSLPVAILKLMAPDIEAL